MNDTTYIVLAYPRDSYIKKIQIELLDVRAADDIQIEENNVMLGLTICRTSSKF